MAYRRIGTTSRVHKCDACGKKDLASTVAFTDGAKTIHLGADCAKKRGGRRGRKREQNQALSLQEMNDSQVLAAVAKIKAAYRSAETKAQRRFAKEKKRAMDFFRGGTDVELAARHNAIRRAEAVLAEESSRARINLIDRLEEVRARAGEWGELVPTIEYEGR